MQDVKPSILEMIKLSVSATNTLNNFMHSSISPAFKNHPDQSHFHSTAMTTYNRISLWLSDLAIVRDPIHFQLAATCVRSIFEHLLDLKWLILNPKDAEKFSAFTLVRRFDIADKISTECKRYPNFDQSLFNSEIKLTSDLQLRIRRDELCKKNNWVTKTGEPRKPKHWWGESTEQRAHAVDPNDGKYLQIFLRYYALLSNHIHPGGVSLIGISGEAIATHFVGLHRLAQDFCLEATEIVCTNFPIPLSVNEEFHKIFFGDAPYY